MGDYIFISPLWKNNNPVIPVYLCEDFEVQNGFFFNQKSYLLSKPLTPLVLLLIQELVKVGQNFYKFFFVCGVEDFKGLYLIFIYSIDASMQLVFSVFHLFSHKSTLKKISSPAADNIWVCKYFYKKDEKRIRLNLMLTQLEWMHSLTQISCKFCLFQHN